MSVISLAEDYFRQMLLRKKELEAVATGVALPEEEHEAGCEVPEDVEDAPEAEASESNEERHEEPASPAVVVPSPVVGPTVGPSEFEPPAQQLGAFHVDHYTPIQENGKRVRYGSSKIGVTWVMYV